jgi:hypothetical protein
LVWVPARNWSRSFSKAIDVMTGKICKPVMDKHGRRQDFESGVIFSKRFLAQLTLNNNYVNP